jgi:hypothetical protein
MLRYQVPKLLFNPKRDTERKKALTCWSRMSRNRCRLKKNSMKKEAKRKKKIKKNTLLYKRRIILDVVHGRHTSATTGIRRSMRRCSMIRSGAKTRDATVNAFVGWFDVALTK